MYEHDGNTLLVLAVSRGASPPYGTTLPGKQGKPVEFYVRRDATTFPARADELRNAVLAAAPWQGSRQYFADVRHLEVPDIQRSPITSDA